MRLPLALIGGAVAAQFLYMIAGMAIFGMLMPFGLDDDLWNNDALSTGLLIVVALACWGVSSWVIWKLLKGPPAAG